MAYTLEEIRDALKLAGETVDMEMVGPALEAVSGFEDRPIPQLRQVYVNILEGDLKRQVERYRDDQVRASVIDEFNNGTASYERVYAINAWRYDITVTLTTEEERAKMAQRAHAEDDDYVVGRWRGYYVIICNRGNWI